MADETHRGRPRTANDVNAMNNVLTPEMVADGWVRLPGGGIVPPHVTNPAGFAGDRDSVNTAEVIAARRAMERAVSNYHRVCRHLYRPGVDMASAMAEAVKAADVMAECWHTFTEVTGESR